MRSFERQRERRRSPLVTKTKVLLFRCVVLNNVLTLDALQNVIYANKSSTPSTPSLISDRFLATSKLFSRPSTPTSTSSSLSSSSSSSSFHEIDRTKEESENKIPCAASLGRRRALSKLASTTTTFLLLGTSRTPPSVAVADSSFSSRSSLAPVATAVVSNEIEPSERTFVRLASGVRFADARVGGGPPATETKGRTLLLHLRAVRASDGFVLLDTRDDVGGGGVPIPWRYDDDVASAASVVGVPGFRSPGGAPLPRVTAGVEDALTSRGTASWEGGYGTAAPMREGGIRLAVVPPSLAYGNGGVSRYEAFRARLRGPVPRDETIAYEIELLRCGEVPKTTAVAGDTETETPTPAGAVAACCAEDAFPCRPPPRAESSSR